MDYSEIQNDFYNSIKSHNNFQSVSHFYRKLKKENNSIISDVLLDVFIVNNKDNNSFLIQEISGGLLWKLKPIYSRNILCDLQKIIPNWDASVEELPWYLAEMIGMNEIKAKIKIIDKNDLPKKDKMSLDNFVHWLSPKSINDFKVNLDKKWKIID